ncbi:MAG: single-stranded DNA-binding protein [bacterium]
MSSVNKVLLLGNLGGDVSLHYFDDKNCVGKFSLATSDSYNNKQGERVTDTTWHNIVVRNKTAELCDKYISKGSKIFLEGKIKINKWQDKDGNDKYTTEIHADRVQFLSGNSQSESNDDLPTI